MPEYTQEQDDTWPGISLWSKQPAPRQQSAPQTKGSVVHDGVGAEGEQGQVHTKGCGTQRWSLHQLAREIGVVPR